MKDPVPDPPADDRQEPAAPTEPEPTTPDEPGEAALRREAANRRRQLRDVEAERDQLRTRVDAYETAQVERQAASSLADPSDIWITTNLDALRDDGGAISQDKISEAVADAIEKKPHWRKAAQPNPDLHGGVRGVAPDPGPSFGTELKKAARGGGRDVVSKPIQPGIA